MHARPIPSVGDVWSSPNRCCVLASRFPKHPGGGLRRSRRSPERRAKPRQSRSAEAEWPNPFRYHPARSEMAVANAQGEFPNAQPSLKMQDSWPKYSGTRLKAAAGKRIASAAPLGAKVTAVCALLHSVFRFVKED